MVILSLLRMHCQLLHEKVLANSLNLLVKMVNKRNNLTVTFITNSL